MTIERSIVVMAGQLAKLEDKAAELATMTSYLRAKLSWMEAGATGEEPAFPIKGWAGETCAADLARPVARRALEVGQ